MSVLTQYLQSTKVDSVFPKFMLNIKSFYFLVKNTFSPVMYSLIYRFMHLNRRFDKVRAQKAC